VWKRPTFILTVAALVVAVLVGGSIYTARGGKFLRGTSSSATKVEQVKVGDPNIVAASGTELLHVASPPSQTRAQIRLSVDIGKPVFIVEFQPFGLADGTNAVVRLTKVTSEGGTQLAGEFARTLVGQNLLVVLGPDDLARLKTGGTYSGRLSLIEEGAVSTFSLASVRRGN
jgi:hypothetical protein